MTTRARSILGFLAAVAALLALFARGAALGTGPVSIALQVAACALMVWARIVFGLRSFHAAAAATRGPLVTRGPFALVRNPIYTSIVMFLAGALVAYPDAWHAAALLVGTAGLLVRIRAEEEELRSAYGAEYAEYCSRVKRLVPFVL